MTAEQPGRGLLDTSAFIAGESGRERRRLPDAGAISVVTIAELYIGVLMADDPQTRVRRLRTLSMVEETFEPLPADVAVARAFAELAADSRRAGRRPMIMDLWIAATAVAHDLPLYTQDRDFQALPGLQVILI